MNVFQSCSESCPQGSKQVGDCCGVSVVFGSGISMLLAHVNERGRIENCCHAAVCVLVTPETVSSQ